MNRRRMMMSQQSKSFELVYDAASGILLSEDSRWSYFNSGYGVGGYHNDSEIENNLLKISCDHLNGFQTYRPIEHLQAKKSEIIIEVESWVCGSWGSDMRGCILGVVLTDGIYYAAVNIGAEKICIGKVSGRESINYGGIWANLTNIDYATPQKFTFRMVFDSGIAYYYINDELLYTQTALLDKTTIQGTTINANEMFNTIRFGAMSTTYISKITYKEW